MMRCVRPRNYRHLTRGWRHHGRALATLSEGSESARGLLEALRNDSGTPSNSSASAPGRMLSSVGGVIQVDLPGPVALGHRVKLGEGGAGAGVVVHFDTKKVSVAMLEQSQLKIGDAAELGGPVSVRVPDLPAQGVKFFSVEDLLVEDSSLPVLRVPEMPSPRRRRPVHTRLPCGLGLHGVGVHHQSSLHLSDTMSMSQLPRPHPLHCFGDSEDLPGVVTCCEKAGSCSLQVCELIIGSSS